MSIIGNAVSVGGGSASGAGAMLRVNSNSTIGVPVTVSKGGYSKTVPATDKHINEDTGFGMYYLTIPSSEFDSTNPFSIILNNESVSDTGSMIISEAKEYNYKASLRKLLFKNGTFGGGLTGFTTLRGDVASQTDTGVISNGNYIYTENDNDYGGITSNSSMSFSGFSKLRIVFDNVASWQDQSFVAQIYLTETKPTRSPYSGGVVAWTVIDSNGGNNITGGSYITEVSLDTVGNRSCYITVFCASGANSGVPHGILNISEISLIP